MALVVAATITTGAVADVMDTAGVDLEDTAAVAAVIAVEVDAVAVADVAVGDVAAKLKECTRILLPFRLFLPIYNERISL